MKIGNRVIGPGEPCYIIAEIGINHNGSKDTAKLLIRAAQASGADAVKFQKRLLPRCVPEHMRDKPKVLQDGTTTTYLEYKEGLEFSTTEYIELADYAHSLGLDFGVSVWDTVSPHWAADLGVYPEKGGDVLPCKIDFLKIPSAAMADEAIVHHTATRGLPFIWSTGMYSLSEILVTRDWLYGYTFNNWGVLHCNSSYPADPSELNLRVIPAWRRNSLFRGHAIGYSGHEVGLAPTVAAAVLGADIIERHITLDRSMWGSDHSASVEPQGFTRLVNDIRTIEAALGDGNKVVYPSELKKKESLVSTPLTKGS